MAARNKRQAARCSKRSFITVMAPVSTTITAFATISGMSARCQPETSHSASPMVMVTMVSRAMAGA